MNSATALTNPSSAVIELSVRVRLQVAARWVSARHDSTCGRAPPPAVTPRRGGSSGRLLIIGAQMHFGDDLLSTRQGGSDSAKFVLAVLEGSGQIELLRAVVDHFADAIDARDVRSLVRVAAAERQASVRDIAAAVGRGATWAKELDGIGRITAEVSRRIDAADRWPTFENHVYVSRGTSEADQLERWVEIEKGAKRAERRATPPDTLDNAIIRATRKLEAGIRAVEKLERRSDWSIEELKYSANAKVLVHQYEKLTQALFGLITPNP